MSTEIKFVSLFEHLHRVAGVELGAQVYEAAKGMSIPTSTREVSTPNYTGKVMLYPQSFLEMYFSNPPKQTVSETSDPMDDFTLGDLQDGDLPF